MDKNEDKKSIWEKIKSFLRELKEFNFFVGWIIAIVGIIYGVHEVKSISQSIAKSSASIDSSISSLSTNVNNIVAKNQNDATINNYLGLLGQSEARITGEFGSAIQACWFYQSTYRNLHPYTVLWEVPEGKDKYPKIRVIADKVTWDAHTCIEEETTSNDEEKKITKLIGDESLIHRIEAKFNKDGDYHHIADAEAYYRSVLHFDDHGRIVHRKIRRTNEYNFELPNSLKGKLDKKIKVKIEDGKNIKLECTEENSNEPRCFIVTKLPELSKSLVNGYNDVRITVPSTSKSLINKFRDYDKAIWLYIESRMQLHNNLGDDGCIAISVEPEPISSNSNNNDKNFIKIEPPSIIFICHKNNKKSHVRVIVRENLEEKKKREKDKLKNAI